MIDWNDFTKMNSNEWIQKANQDSKGKYVAEDFVYNVENDFLVSPFTDYEADIDNAPLYKTPTKSGITITWTDSKTANTVAIQYLETGVESLIFHVGIGTDYSILFKDIFLEFVSILLITKDDISICKKQLKNYFEQNVVKIDCDITLVQDENKNLKANQSFKERIIQCAQWVKNNPVGAVLAIFVEPKTDFLAQIAELRAIRKLWQQHNHPHNNLKIIVTSAPKDVDNDIHPLIIENYKLMSAYLGMSDIVAIPMEADQEMTRLLLNMTYIFKEESRLSTVLDPVAGSYIIENLTAQIVATAS